ncbi:MAG: hypothetical protein DDG60_11765 [Anaerolineae bacterium]|nr:MAG: hypothetical protein DDG60_11765 [Anaerolineae bacterium]
MGANKYNFTSFSHLYHKCIDELFIYNKVAITRGLRECDLTHIKQYLAVQLEEGVAYGSFHTKKDYANWFEFINDSLRWCPANFADLSYFAQPVHLLSDLEAVKLGLSSDEWENYVHGRLRKLNAKLLPEVTVKYDNGYEPHNTQTPSLVEVIRREYLYGYLFFLSSPHALFVRLNPQKLSPPGHHIRFSFERVAFDAKNFTDYFTGNFDEILGNPNYPYWLKRAAVTVGYVLEFLENSA